MLYVILGAPNYLYKNPKKRTCTSKASSRLLHKLKPIWSEVRGAKRMFEIQSRLFRTTCFVCVLNEIGKIVDLRVENFEHLYIVICTANVPKIIKNGFLKVGRYCYITSTFIFDSWFWEKTRDGRGQTGSIRLSRRRTA